MDTHAARNQIVREIRFGFLGPHRVAGMGEPWSMKIRETLDLLVARGIRAILTLTEDDLYGDQYLARGFLHHHEPIEDCEPPTTEGMDRALAFVASCLQRPTGVAIHCFEGRGRTGTVLAAWLGRTETLDAAATIRRIHELRPCTVLTPTQRAFLETYLGRTR